MTLEKHIDTPVTDKPTDNWHALNSEEILHQLATPSESGLSSQEAAHRLEQYGANQLEEAPGITFW